MATVHAVAVVANTGCASPQNALGASDGVWTGNTDGTAWDARWGLDDPGSPLEGTQTVRVQCRKSEIGGNGDPAVTVELWEAGVFVATLASTTVSSLLGTDVTGTFDGASVSNTADLQVRVSDAGMGGQKNGRRAIQVDAIALDATLGTPQQHESGGGVSSVQVTSTGAGQAAEAGQGGGVTIVSVLGSGNGQGQEAAAGGGAALVTVAASGGGSGSGSQQEAGGGVAAVSVTAQGKGTSPRPALQKKALGAPDMYEDTVVTAPGIVGHKGLFG